MNEQMESNGQAAENIDPTLNRATDAIIRGEYESMQAIPVEMGRAISQDAATMTEDYPSPGGKTAELAMQYPGKRPESAYSLSGEQVSPGDFLGNGPIFMLAQNGEAVNYAEVPAFYVNVKASDGKEYVSNIDDLLRNLESAPMADRIPVIAFGSNANPSQLAQKFAKLEGVDKTVVPTLRATVKGVMPAYVARIGINGYVFTDLAPTSDPNAECEVYINFLTRAQLEAMNATEKAYSLCKMDDVKIGNIGQPGFETSAYLYVGRDDNFGANVLTDDLGRPIRLAELHAAGGGVDQEFASMTQAQVQQYLYEIAGKQIAESLLLEGMPTSPSEIIEMIVNRTKDPRLESFRKEVTSQEGTEGLKLLGRHVGLKIQQAIEGTGHFTQANFRSRVKPQNRDVEVGVAETFGQISQKVTTPLEN